MLWNSIQLIYRAPKKLEYVKRKVLKKLEKPLRKKFLTQISGYAKAEVAVKIIIFFSRC